MKDPQGFLPEAMARLKWSRDQILATQTLGLQLIVAHAHSPFYASPLGSWEASRRSLSDLRKIPPLTIDMVMAHREEFVTEPPRHPGTGRLTRFVPPGSAK